MENISEILAKNPIVIDNGSGSMKAGFGGEDKPRTVFPTYVGRAKYKALPIANQQDVYVGSNIKEDQRGLLKLKYPLLKGHVVNWNDMDLIWRHTYSELKVSAKEFPVLLTEPAMNPINQKDQTCQYFFENYSAPALFFAVQGVLSLFASGKTTGVVLDSGDGVSHTVPIYDGFMITHACQRVDLGGRDVTENLINLLRRSGYTYTTSAEFEIVKKLKEKRCLLSPSQIQEEKYAEERKIKEQYMLPDNSLIDLSYEKQRAPEILFTPERYGLEMPSIPELISNTFLRVDVDLRKQLYHEIVITGGNTQIQGFPERMITEVKKLIPKDAKVKLFCPPDRTTLCWQGGSILSHLASFKSMWILRSPKEYEEEGERILQRKQL